MKKIKNYYQFILESILYASDDLNKILDEMKSPIALKFKELIGKDIKTKYNLLKPSSSDSVSFTNDSNLKSIKPEEYKGGFNTISVGRLVKNILKDNDIQDFGEKDIEDFVNEFKYLNERGKTTGKIKIVEGEDIRKYYHENNYESNRGTLANSCMKYARCQSYLQIYVDNPAQIKMVVLFGKDDKIKARALLWKTDIGYYLDRIYHTDRHEEMVIKNWVKENISKDIKFYPVTAENEMYVKLSSKNEYMLYPYMDTFQYYIPSNGALLSYNHNLTKLPFNIDEIFVLDDVNGRSSYVVSNKPNYNMDDDDVSDFWSEFNSSR